IKARTRRSIDLKDVYWAIKLFRIKSSTPKKMSSITKRNHGIDIIRGLCILAVILLHINIRFQFTQTFIKEIFPKKLFSLLFWSGFYGVIIFFTLSGFLITSSIYKKWGKLSQIDLKTFYWYRFARIIPLLTLILLILSILHLTNVSGFVINPDKTSLARAIFAALTFHINWLEIQVGYLPANWDVLWSISIEETFYLVFPLVCLFLKKDGWFVGVLILCMTISPWARIFLFPGNELADKNHLAYLDSIALGCMAAIIANRFSVNLWTRRTLFFLGLAMAIAVLYFRGFIYRAGLTNWGLNITVLSTGVALMLLWLNKHPSMQGKQYFNWLINMGRYSYEIYLTHMFVIIFGHQLYNYFEPGDNWLIPYSLLLIVLSFYLGKLVFNSFSEPLNLWLRKKWSAKTLENSTSLP
ncbi:MAG: acyltransferase, partial [Bacteroidota bacterium]